MPADANRIGYLRKIRKISQEELAEQLFMDRSTLCKYEKGTRDIPSTVLVQLADYFNVSIDYLLCNNMTDSDISDMAEEIKRKIDTMNEYQLYEIKGYIAAISKIKEKI